jgi:hypothetical protein
MMEYEHGAQSNTIRSSDRCTRIDKYIDIVPIGGVFLCIPAVYWRFFIRPSA